jgi:D-alanyl-D-alanine carboxypeptidase (penicillin-binding protein 5/6)
VLALVVAPAAGPGGAAAKPEDKAPQQAPPKAPAAPSAAEPSAPAGPPKLAAKTWILIDPRDDEVLAAKGADRSLPIASATKLMTAYLALKKLRPKETLTAPPYNALPAESLIGLEAGEKMTVRDLLYGLILESGNDAAVTLAEGVSGSVPKFVDQMNRTAASLGLEETSYENPIGLDAPDNYSSASDLVALADSLLADPLFARIADTSSVTLRSGNRPRAIDSRNTLLGADPTIDGVKTGHTLQAGYVLVGSATRNGTRLVSAVLGAGSEAARDAETMKLLDYGFSLYRAERPVEAGEELADPKLDYRDDRLALVAKRGVEVSAREGQAVDTVVDAPDEVSGAIEEGEALGSVIVSVDGERADKVPLVASRSVEAATLFDKAIATAQNPLILLPLGGIVIVVGLLLARRGRAPREEPAAPQPVATTEQGPKEPKEPKGPKQRTPEERRKMHEERMRRRRERNARRGER